ncbi:cohesin domain-containing protein [Granulicella sibirica]|nr:cohesin domain-containing protein [Granulicella sibirica]
MVYSAESKTTRDAVPGGKVNLPADLADVVSGSVRQFSHHEQNRKYSNDKMLRAGYLLLRLRFTPHGVKDANRTSMGRGVISSFLSEVLPSKRRVALLALVSAGVIAVPSPKAEAQSARTWNKRAQNAELHEDYDTAYEDYRQAALKAPADLRYKTRYERMRFLAGVSHVDRGRVLKQSGDIPAALNEFARALAVDPSNQTATQEINLIQHPDNMPPPPGAPPTPESAALEQTPYQAETLRTINSVAGPVQLQPVSNDPITLHAVEDTKVIYQTIGKLAGLNVLFDPDYQSKRIPVDLQSVTLFDAFRIVGTLAGTFFKPVTANTIFVAQNNRTKRTDLDELSVQTFYLTNIGQAQDLNEILTTVRNMLDPTVKIYSVASQNAIILRATPDQLLLAQKIINDLDRARSEVVVDVAVLQVNRDRVRNLGITLPQSFTLTPQAATSSTSSTSSSTSTSTTSTTSTFTLNSLANLNATNFAVGLTGGTLNALLTDSDTRILQNPRIRATDGQRATLKIGSRIPIATGSYSSGVSTGTVSLGVQTQFTYLDVGVNIDLTPTVHYDHEITLKLKIEVSSQSGTVTISSVSEPIIAQNVIEQTIQLKEGEPSIIAGILTKQDNRTNSGTPGLAEIPFLKYFFGTQGTEKQQNEVVFLLIPHLVRESVLTRVNTSPIDTGTSTSYELRRSPATFESAGAAGAEATANLLAGRPVARATGPTTTAANAAAAMAQQLAQQAEKPLPPTAAAAAAQNGVPLNPGAASGPVSLGVVPASPNQAVGATFQVAVSATNAHDLYAVPLQMQFDPKVLQLVNVDAGDFLGRDGQAVAIVHRDEGNGLVTISTSRPPSAKGVDGQGNICTLTFKAIAAGDSQLTLTKVGAKNSAQASLPAVGSQATVHVK